MDAKKICSKRDLNSALLRGRQIPYPLDHEDLRWEKSCKSNSNQFATVSFMSEWNESASRSGKIQLLGLFINYD